MEIRKTQIKELFKSRYPWSEEIVVTDNTDWYECDGGPHWHASVNDDGVWREFRVQIKVKEIT